MSFSPSPEMTGSHPVLSLLQKAGIWLDHLIPDEWLDNPETTRRARLMTRFGSLGSIFGLIYMLFYLAIGHYWGAGIIAVCTVGIALSPFLMKGSGSIEPAAHFFSGILTAGFLGLCFVEGGSHGHAIAWLVSVPLCALILTGVQPALKWVAIAFLAAALVVGLDLAGIELPVTFDPKWTPLVSAAGYTGLVIFMSLLGLIFETGRASAFARMQEALGELKEKNLQLVELDQEKSEFLGIAAHDLKNPLTVILGSGELLKFTHESGRIEKLADAIVASASRMHKLITNLLDVQAIEEGRYASNLVKCDLSELVHQCIEHNRPNAHQKGIVLRSRMPDDVYVKADATATSQILDNLISNAVKYAPHHSTVHIDTGDARKDTAVVRVRDEGPGISREDQKKLFQKFSRLSALPTGGESSNGLGLSIAKKLAVAMQGEVACESELGTGATFSLRLGLWPTDISAPITHAPKSLDTGRVKLSIDVPESKLSR